MVNNAERRYSNTCQILKLDIGGRPVEWLAWAQAVTLYCNDKIGWEAGEDYLEIFGGTNRMGRRSRLHVSTIVAVRDRSPRVANHEVPPLTRRELYRRDRGRCLYCGTSLRYHDMEFEHVIPKTQGGRHTWTNVVSACSSCNRNKNARTPEQAGMPLIALPFEPNRAQWLLLANHKVLADQQRFLESMAPRHSV